MTMRPVSKQTIEKLLSLSSCVVMNTWLPRHSLSHSSSLSLQPLIRFHLLLIQFHRIKHRQSLSLHSFSFSVRGNHPSLSVFADKRFFLVSRVREESEKSCEHENSLNFLLIREGIRDKNSSDSRLETTEREIRLFLKFLPLSAPLYSIVSVEFIFFLFAVVHDVYCILFRQHSLSSVLSSTASRVQSSFW
jgi:hypothetical protein